MKDKEWLKRIPFNELRTPIGMYNGSPVTPVDIVKSNIPENKVEPLDFRIARELAINTINTIIKNSSGLVTGSGMLVDTRAIPQNLTDRMALSLIKRGRRYLQK